MAKIIAWLLAAAGPLVKKALIALGIGWISTLGVEAALTVAKNAVLANWGAISGVTAQVLGLFGFGEALGILLGALAARGSLVAYSHLGKLTS